MKYSLFRITTRKLSFAHTSYLALGSNIGNRFRNINRAVSLLKDYADIKVVSTSQVYKNPCLDSSNNIVGGENEFLNGVVKIETNYNPEDLLKICKSVEKKLGRTQKEKHYSARSIDIDIILYDDLKYLGESLKIPHPRMLEREFVLRPLIDVLDLTERTNYLPYIQRLLQFKVFEFDMQNILRYKKMVNTTKCLYAGESDNEISSIQRVAKLEITNNDTNEIKYLLSKVDCQMIEIIDNKGFFLDPKYLRQTHPLLKNHSKVNFVCLNLNKVCRFIKKIRLTWVN